MESQIYLLPITFPLWGIFLGIVSMALLALELGFMLGRRRQRRGKTNVHEEPRAMSGALLGFLAFVLAITFGNQESRFDRYRKVAVDEANAIPAITARMTWRNRINRTSNPQDAHRVAAPAVSTGPSRVYHT